MIVQELRDVFVYARIKVWKAHERKDKFAADVGS